jgi:ADP-dependent NAD(P)H-hydrate dehydratase / NAD(P)H-hydrate epimerase
MKVLSPERMARYDDYAIRTWGIPSAVLMENAGRNTYRLMKEAYLGGMEAVGVVCGRGNNGGDGFVIARYALAEGHATKVFLLCRKTDLKGDAALNMRLYESVGGKLLEMTDDVEPLRQGIREAKIIVDAIFGTGLSKVVEGLEKQAIALINASALPVISVDIPSGIDGRTGEPLGEAVKATHTYTYGYPKIGQILYPGAYHTGRLTVIDISLPKPAEAILGADGFVVDGEMIRGFLKDRLPWAHKGTFGHAAVIAGSSGKTGAAYMASTAALKIGAGLVTLLIPESLNGIMETKTTEVMTYPIADSDKGYFDRSAYDSIMRFIEDKDVVVMGPGVGQQQETMEVMRRIFRDSHKPFVVDADGINAFKEEPGATRCHRGDAVFTPHPGELSRLLATTPVEINKDRMGWGKRFVEQNGVNLLLKGARSIFFSLEGETYIIPAGNTALAKGGSGDILTGFVGGLISQGYSAREATLFGAYLHGYLADSWVEEKTEMDLLACDLLEGVGKAIREIRDGRDRVYIEKSL